MKNARLVAVAVLSACMTAPNTGPVPELPTGIVWQRGTDAQAERLGNADEQEIIANVVRGFFRPIRNQVRIIHDRPLSNFQDVVADSAMPPDRNRAEALTRTIGLQRVCTQASNTECSGMPGGTLRFSRAYGVAKDTALIYAQYGNAPGGLEFRMVRRPDGWHMAARRSVSGLGPDNPPARVVANQLLETDRAYGVAARGTDVITALSAMFDDSVVVPGPGGFADGKEAAVAALRATADNARSHITWDPIRVGVSADGLHGFTYGYMTLTRPDGSRAPLKYLAYWVRRGGEWKVLAYKRRPRPAGEVSIELLPPALPQPATRNPQPGAAESLAAAEKEFSDTSQTIGIGPAFERYGRLDAMNMGGPADTAFVIGNKAVGRSVGAGYPSGGSPVHWASDHKTIVAPSGDLGVTFGYIRPHTPPPAGQPQFFPFFTIWKRDPGGPWRYIAE